MSIPGSASPLFLASTAAAGAYDIPRSLRFNSGDSAYLNRTPSSAGNRRTWTWSSWVKRTALDTEGGIFSTYAGAHPNTSLFWESNGLKFHSYNGSSYVWRLGTAAVYRDVSAWYHIVLAFDSTETTASDRAKLWVNGAAQTLSGTEVPLDNQSDWNSATQHDIGKFAAYFDGYMADIHFIDSQALAASDFGEYDDNNVWQPKAYAGTYGTNGFKLDFSDTSSDSALGTDSSGQGNDWSVNNLSVGAAAVDYSGNGQMSGPWNPAPNDAAAGFDGSIEGPNVPYAANSTAAFTWTPSTPISYSTNVEMYVGNVFGFRYDLNGGGWVTPSLQSWNTIATGSGTITTIKVDRNGDTTYGWHAIKVDGTILVNSAAVITDALRDSPVNGDSANDTGAGGEITGNYATWNPLFGENQSLSNGNLKAESSTTGYAIIASTIAMKSGKWYMEYTYTPNNDQPFITWGISQTNRDGTAGSGVSDTAEDKGFKAWDSGFYSQSAGQNVHDYSSSVSSGDIISLAFDADAGKLWVAKNGTWMTNASGTGNPATGANPDYSSLTYSGGYYFMAGPYYTNGSTLEANFGARAFAYTAPSGYKCLNTANLSDPTIADGSTAFDTKLWTGNGGTTTVTGVEFEPSMLWIKGRSYAENHGIFDAVRGVGSSDAKRLQPNTTAQEYGVENAVNSFNSDGFTLGSNNSHNRSSETYVGWAWDAGSSTVTNTDGSISSQVRANPSAGFSIVTYTGNGTINSTIGHGIAAPEFIIIKNRSNSYEWAVLHTSVGTTGTTLDGSPEYYMLQLDSTAARNNFTSDNIWDPTSSTFKINGEGTGSWVNASGDNYVAYCFAPVEGYSAFGSYTGNGSETDGPFVFLNFAPAFLLVKRTDSTGNWILVDQTRGEDNALYPNQNISEASASFIWVDFVSNGFKIRSSIGAVNASGGDYIYWAVAKNPFSSNGGLAR